jgi:hypothetical protein
MSFASMERHICWSQGGIMGGAADIAEERRRRITTEAESMALSDYQA